MFSVFLQYLLESGWAAEGHVIGVTQPRRVAAVTVSLYNHDKEKTSWRIANELFCLLS